MSDANLVSRSAPYVAGATPNTGDAWANEAASTGAKGTQRIRSVGLAQAFGDIARMLTLTPGTLIVVRRRLVLLADRPVEMADAYYPATIARDTPLASPGKIKGGAAGWLADHGYTADHVHEEISARLPNADERMALDIGDTDPILILKRTSYTADGQPFEAAIMTMRADRRTLAYDLSSAA